MNDRIKKLRRELDLTQQEFAARIGSVQNTITGYETGRRTPSNQVISLICKEFHVREEWLRTGEGEMFAPDVHDEFEALLARYPNLTHESIVFIKKFVAQPKEFQDVIFDFLRDVVKSFDEIASAEAPEPVQEDLYAELDRQIDLEKKAEEKSEVS